METKIVDFNTKSIKALQNFTSKDKTREYLMQVVYNNTTKNISATDGKICAKIDKVEFEVLGNLFNITIIGDNKILLTETNLGYPNVNKIFPNFDDLTKYQERSISLKGNKKFVSIEISRLINTLDHIINFSYLLKFPKEDFTCYESKEHSSIIFRGVSNRNLSIIVMPISKE